MTKKLFVKKLLQWNKTHNHRTMPWKGEKNPYFIWLSEIILQQTRVEQGLEYYLKFIKEFPTVSHLADASEDKVMRLWQGLGYYTRARNLHASAKIIQHDHHGIFPNNYENILKLKGIGKYTAAAISSFGFNLPHAVVDGNVIRVLSRVFGIKIAYDTAKGIEEFNALAHDLLDCKNPGVYNQAIMDFGATICMPTNPNCIKCVMHKDCEANQQNIVKELPVKNKRITLKKRYFIFKLWIKKEKICIEKREEKDIWRNLYQFPLEEIGEKKFNSYNEKEFTQKLTHQKIHAKFIYEKVANTAISAQSWVDIKCLNNFGFPKIICTFIESNNLKIDRHV